MGKYLITILFFLLTLGAYAQYPGIQSIGTDSSLVTAKGGLKGRIVNTPFTDTTQANTQRIKFYNGAQIVTYTGGAKFWIRDSALTKWIQLSSGGGSGDAYLDTTYRRADTVFGVKDGVELIQWIFSSDSAEVYQWSVIDSLSVPPTSPEEGDKYLVGTAPTGVWTGFANQIATYDSTGNYTFETATTGDLLYNATLAVVDKFNGATWDRLVTPTNVNWWTRLNGNNVAGQFARIGPDTYSSLQPNSTSYGFRTYFSGNPNGQAGSSAFGAFALYHNHISGYNNTAIGDRAMWYTSSGHDNVAVGKNAMSASGNVNYSVALGTNSVGYSNTLSISDFVTKMRMKLDSASGTPFSIVGVDALGNWRRYATPSGGGGNLINGGANIGTGAEVFKDTSSNKLNFRRLNAGTGISVTQNTNDITISTDGVASVLSKGTFAQRPSSPDTGAIYEQTDRLAGTWKYNGHEWQFLGVPENYILNNKFFSVAPTNNQIAGAGASVSIFDTTKGPGFLRLTTGTTTSGAAATGNSISSALGSNYYLLVDSVVRYFEARVKVSAVSNATDNYNLAVGFNGHQWPTLSNYIVFRHNYTVYGGNWDIRSAGSSVTSKNSGVPVVANTWYKLAFEIDGYAKTIKYYIDDVLVGTMASPDNVPFNLALKTNAQYNFLILKSAGTTPVQLDAQYIKYYQTKAFAQ